MEGLDTRILSDPKVALAIFKHLTIDEAFYYFQTYGVGFYDYPMTMIDPINGKTYTFPGITSTTFKIYMTFRNEGINAALGSAAIRGKDEEVKILLKMGADVNAINESGDTPLKLAKMLGNDSTVQILKAAGATR